MRLSSIHYNPTVPTVWGSQRAVVTASELNPDQSQQPISKSEPRTLEEIIKQVESQPDNPLEKPTDIARPLEPPLSPEE